MEEKKETFPAGLLARYYAARHSHAHYRSSAVTGVYNFPSLSIGNITNLLKFSLQETIRRHPGLCFHLNEKSGSIEAHFIRLAVFNWDDVVEFKTSDIDDPDEALETELGISHEHRWNDPSKPVWKIVVLTHTHLGQGLAQRVNILFIAHHAISDGGSGAAFHKTLYRLLNTQAPASTVWPFKVPTTTKLPIAVEEAFPFSTSTVPITNPPAPQLHPWTAEAPSLPPTTNVYLLTVPSSSLSHVLQHCRRHSTTLTALLNTLILTYLSTTIPSATAFTAITPYSMRRFTRVSNDEIVNHISSISSTFSTPLLNSLRSPETSDDEALVSVSRQCQAEISNEFAQVPEYGPSALVAISGVEDFDTYCDKGMEGPRGATYEVSNLGAVAMGNAGERVGVEKLVFTQCGMVVGPAIGCNIVSTAGGPLVVSLTWQEGVVGRGFMQGMKKYLERRLLGFEE